MSLFDSASLCITPNAYKASKLYAIKPTDGSGDLTVVRATTARRVNSARLISSVANNVPRLDYTNSTCPSILVEPQRTNLTQRSEDFSNGYWGKTNSDITSNTAIAPDGNLTADTFSDRVLTTQTYVLRRNQSYTSGTAYTSSFFAKNLDRRYVYVRFVSNVFGTNKYVFFDLQLGTIIRVDSGVTAEIINYGNGWFRCIATSTALLTTSVENGILIGLSDNGVNVAYTNPSVKSIYLWGAQLEAGSNATSYISTAASAVTRNADVISKTGISSLINSVEGCFYVEAKSFVNGGSFRQFSLSNGTDNSRLVIGWSSVASRLLVRLDIGGTNIVNTDILSFNQTSNNKVLFKWGGGNFKVFINGVEKLSLTSLTMPTANLFTKLGFDRGSSAGFFEGNVNEVIVFPTQLTDDECINLTTI